MNTFRSQPQAVIELASRLGARLGAGPTVHLSQTGRMRSSATAAWRDFTANQTISQHECAFEWNARSGPLGSFAIRDALVDGEGRLDVRVLGILPIAHLGPSSALTRGEVIRYLAELAWSPDAILTNRELRWIVDATGSLRVAAGSGATEAQVAVALNPEGRIAEVYSPDRGFLADGAFISMPWRGRFGDYRLHQGRWLPFAAEVAWGQGESAWTYWQGRIQDWSQSLS